jgi:predicted PhzF superfamily epimerase YddE/YHI9
MTAALLIEAFSDRPCCGNGAAVVLLERPWSDARLQALAGSLRQSETAYLLRCEPHWLLRWFTPSVEVPLCGHATLAALLALGHWRLLAPGQEVHFLSRSGPLAGRLAEQGGWGGSIDLPGGGLRSGETPADLEALLQRRGLGPALQFWSSELGYAVVLLAAAAPLAAQRGLAAELPAALRPGLVLMQAVTSAGLSAVADDDPQPATLNDRPLDYRLRFFAPGLGIEEDPVTGSAHALVAPWWQRRLGRSIVVGWQCSDRPGGVVCEGLPSGMIRVYGMGHLLWDGTLHTETWAEQPVGQAPCWQPCLPWPAGSEPWRHLLASA